MQGDEKNENFLICQKTCFATFLYSAVQSMLFAGHHSFRRFSGEDTMRRILLQWGFFKRRLIFFSRYFFCKIPFAWFFKNLRF
jgi:hypothetical protein